jgi:hypothetical protein
MSDRDNGCDKRCPARFSRREFLGTMGAAGASALALQSGLMAFAASALGADAPPASAGPRLRATFIRPREDKFWMGWPGASYDLAGHQKLYTETLQKAAARHGARLEFAADPIYDAAGLTAFLESCQKDPPDGVILTIMHLDRWGDVNTFCEKRGAIPTVVFSPMGTSFTGHLGPTRTAKNVFVAATQDVDALDFGVKLQKAVWQMKNTRIVIAAGDKAEDKTLEILGTGLHYVPRSRFPEELAKVQASDEAKALAAFYRKEARKIVEPSEADVLNAAKNYVACRNLMKAENAQAVSMDCLGLVGSRQIPCPPCVAYSHLLDEGVAGVCEADVGAALSHLVTLYVCDRPGFQQDPAPNTVNNTLMGAHCTCATKLDGFDKPHEPIILRSHSESNIGVSPQVLWRLGQKVTVMKCEGPGSMLLGTGRVLANIDTPPSGGCRTSVEIEVDDVADSRSVKGFHQLFIYGDQSLKLKAFAALAGVNVVHI